MRISDWSSDVCSSDLLRFQSGALLFDGGRLAKAVDRDVRALGRKRAGRGKPDAAGRSGHKRALALQKHRETPRSVLGEIEGSGFPVHQIVRDHSALVHRLADRRAARGPMLQHGPARRSEEPTSELQSLMSTSYAVS